MDYEEFCCTHEDCPDFGRYHQGNIRLKERYGRNRTALLWCRTCHRTFSETRETPLFKSMLPLRKWELVLRALADGNGIRATSRIAKVTTGTVTRVLEKAGQHAREFNDFMLRDLKLSQVQVDEIWTFVKKRRGRRSGKAKR
jgi:transposase-like protein